MMGTLAERFEGRFVGTVFPPIPLVPPSFPPGKGRVRQQLNAGVAELVDALDLGSSGRPNRFKALQLQAPVLWVRVRKPPFEPIPVTSTSTGEQTLSERNRDG